MGIRLATFDYKSPYFYMVTLKAEKGALPFVRIRREPLQGELAHSHGRGGTGPAQFIEANAVTRAFVDVITGFHKVWRCVEPIETFSVMPDHIHLLIKLRKVADVVSLPKIVWQLRRHLERAYRSAVGAGREAAVVAAASGTLNCGDPTTSSAESRAGGFHVFEREWHDWIVKKNGQLAAFTRYIRENPRRAWLRASHRENFRRVGEIGFLGRKWFGYGNAALLDLPVIEPFRCSRKWAVGGPEWREAVARAERIGPGCAGIGTFMSPCEKACGNAIAKAGGRLIVLSPEGFGERWHPGPKHEPFCADGRMLFLSLYPEMARQPTRKELYDRCHEMGDVVLEGLSRL